MTNFRQGDRAVVEPEEIEVVDTYRDDLIQVRPVGSGLLESLEGSRVR